MLGACEEVKAIPGTSEGIASVAKEGLDYCNKLFAIERELRDVTPEERYEERLKRSKPILDEFYSYLKYHMPRVLPKSVLGGAIRYCLNQWDKLTAFLLDGRLEIDNNISERSIKPFVIGRKNWLFSNTPKGARASATIYSIVETAKENGLKPYFIIAVFIFLWENKSKFKEREIYYESKRFYPIILGISIYNVGF